MDLRWKIEEVVENLRPSASKAGVDIENNVTGSMPIRANKTIGEAGLFLSWNSRKSGKWINIIIPTIPARSGEVKKKKMTVFEFIK